MTYPSPTDPGSGATAGLPLDQGWTTDTSTAGTSTADTSTADVAKDQASQVAGSATDAGKHVAGVAKEQAGNVAATATGQAKDLLRQSRGELTDQAATQKDRVSGGLRSLGDELRALADGSDQPGTVTDLAHQAASRTTGVADWLEAREPGHVLDEVTRYARQKPGTFLAVAAGAGFLLGRFGRGLLADHADDGTAAAPTAPATPTPVRGTPSAGTATTAPLPQAVGVGDLVVDPVTGRVAGVTP